MLTEQEAQSKWCPFARVPEGNGSAGLTATNRHAGKKIGADGKPRILRGNSMCIASQCMAWRWQDGSHFDSTRNAWVVDYGQHGKGLARGYCGLAGVPR